MKRVTKRLTKDLQKCGSNAAVMRCELVFWKFGIECNHRREYNVGKNLCWTRVVSAIPDKKVSKFVKKC